MPFNFALEPLLLAVDQDNRMARYRFFNSGVEHRVKASAYPDDICILLNNGSDDAKLQHQLFQYSVVSTAEFDQEKNKSTRYEWTNRGLVEKMTATTTSHGFSQQTIDRAFQTPWFLYYLY